MQKRNYVKYIIFQKNIILRTLDFFLHWFYTESTMRQNEDKITMEMNLLALQAHGGIATTKGSSMLPLIKDGSRVTLQPIQPSQIRIGHIVAFRPKQNRTTLKNDLIAHRVVGNITIFGKQFLFLKGDNDTAVDLVTNEQLVGKVSHIFCDNKNETLPVDTIPKNLVSPFFFFTYFFLRKLKQHFLGRKKYLLSSLFSRLYWNVAKSSQRK